MNVKYSKTGRFAMKRVLFRGLCLMLVSLCGCGSAERPESVSSVPSNEELVEAAYATYRARSDAVRGGTPDPTNEYYPTYWAPGIKALNPIKVYKHMNNIVVVRRIEDGAEYGKYIHIPISSYLPMRGDYGFTFYPEPLNGNIYTLHNNGVFDYKRTRE